MPLEPGTTLGPYSVTAEIGEGGMGEVYRARDTKLDRDVALKVLPEAFTADPDRLARFEREAKVLASLNHPNIAGIYGLEETADTKALVLELVEGPTLADRIKEGPIPVDEALPVAKQIAEALEAAHEQGIIHRDLKPANIKVREDGTVKVLDFGLAKALDTTLEGDPSQSPTVTAAATAAGAIMGTAAYMSPEQARGKPVDRRSDIWSFGAVFYEMLAGSRAFDAETVSDTTAAILTADVRWGQLRPDVPPTLRDLLVRCLDKDSRRRLRDIGEARLVLEDTVGTASADWAALGQAAGRIPRSSAAILWQLVLALIALVVGVVVGGALVRQAMSPASLEVMRFTIPIEDTHRLLAGDVAISPDVSVVAYVTADATNASSRQLQAHRPGQLSSLALVTSSESLSSPFFSPDGEWIGYWDEGIVNPTLKRVSVHGGYPQTISELPGPLRGASWTDDDTIVFGQEFSGLWRVSASGGPPVQLTQPQSERGVFDHRWPVVLPDGDTVLFTAVGESVENSWIAVLSLDTGEQRNLLRGYDPRYSSTGHVVFGNGGTLWATRFDADSLETVGSAVPLQDGVLITNTGAASFDLARGGALAYLTGTYDPSGRQLVWVDREGREQALPLPVRRYLDPRLSPDGLRIAVAVDQELWVYDADSASGQRLTQGYSVRTPAWTPDGERVIFTSLHGETGNMYAVRADGSGQPQRLVVSEEWDYVSALDPKGRTLVFTRIFGGPVTGHREFWQLELDRDDPPQPWLRGEFARSNTQFSPDGNWITYHSNQSGTTEVYVQPYPGLGPVLRISAGGGDHAMWSPDGSRIFYRSGDRMMASSFEPAGTPMVGVPAVAFEGTYFTTGSRSHDLAPDGRFLMMKSTPDAVPQELVVAFNWTEELRARVPAP